MMAKRKLIVQQWVTVDNIAAEEDGGLSFVSGEPFSDKTNPAFKDNLMGFIDSVDTMILGANTYAQSKDYWPNADEQGEYGEKLNNLIKFVASSKLDDAPWGDFPAATLTSDPAATIRELKEQTGKDVWLLGRPDTHALHAGRGRRRRSPDAGLPGSTRQGNAHFRGLAGPGAGEGHRIRQRPGTSALRDQEVGGMPARSPR
jgi:dihydrofolate reductase